MAIDLLQPLHSRKDEIQPQSDNWLADNVLKPFVNGTGAIQIYDTVAGKDLSTYQVKEAPTFSGAWCAQALSGAAGAIVPYVLAGKATGLGMRAVGERLGLEGAAARLMASQSVAQIGGAGLYEFAQKPAAGQTRTGNAAGTMAGFALFSGGELALAKTGSKITGTLENAAFKGASRLAVGAVGGLGSYESTNYVSALLGVKHQENWDERWKAMTQSGFVYLGLPVLQEGANKVLDKTIYSLPTSKGLPVQREIKLSGYRDPELAGLVHDNALARVKRADGTEAQADLTGNRVLLGTSDGAAKLAHEMVHLTLARQAEPIYAHLAELKNTNPEEARESFFALRAEMEGKARQVEQRVQDRTDAMATANGADRQLAGVNPNTILDGNPGTNFRALPVVTDPALLGGEPAIGGKTYHEVWENEWQQFQANPAYRPPVEYGGIVKWTAKYEKWMSDQINVDKTDLAKKHLDMASDPFKFLRATYYRWAKMFPKLLPELADAPKVKSVGDMHIDNFGTWTDRFKRWIWGVNDFDEAYRLPYTNDLVRLMTSANVASGKTKFKTSIKDACDIVLDGYKQSLKDGGKPFVLDGENNKLARIAKGQVGDDQTFWSKLTGQLRSRSKQNLPTEAMLAVESILPKGGGEVTWGHRQAGEGSLGRQRVVGLTEKDSQHHAGEAKNFLPSANYFAEGKGGGPSYYNSTIDSAVRFKDPFARADGNWIKRILGPDHSKIELGELGSAKDERTLLWAMGYEIANIHLGSKNAASKILPHLESLNHNWLYDAVQTMTAQNQKDQTKWKNHMEHK